MEEVNRLKAERTVILRNITFYCNKYNSAWGNDDEDPQIARAKTYFDSVRVAKDKLLNLERHF